MASVTLDNTSTGGIDFSGSLDSSNFVAPPTAVPPLGFLGSLQKKFHFDATQMAGLIAGAGLNLTVAATPSAQIPAGNQWNVSYTFATPEPTSMAILGAGAAGLFGFARRRRK
jgi:hypothetical protein